DTSAGGLRLRASPELALEDDLLPEQLLLLRHMRLLRRIGAGHASDLGKLLIDPLQLVLESLKLSRFGRRCRCRRSLGLGARWRLSGGAGLVLDALSIGRDNVGRLARLRMTDPS